MTDYALKILCGARLEDKLEAPPAGISYAVLDGVVIPTVPNRHVSIDFSDREKRLFPKYHNDEDAARILHAFANHELLAIELMALALLKFQHAPLNFRKGLLNTLREEQEHCRLYCRRIEELGYQFGDFPLNDFFWRLSVGMKEPIDYITRMSLTFEQANLDYCQYYMGLFSEAGDEATANLLEHVYLDEIAHVRFGAKWFERVEAPLSFANYQAHLPWPLTPTWGRGKGFDHEGRMAAGLSAEFCDDMELFHQSRGRAPDIFFFYPEAEGHCLNRPKMQPKKRHFEMREDLQLLPLFLAKRDDMVLLHRLPSRAHRKRLLSYGISGVELVEGQDHWFQGDIPNLSERKFHRLQPWGWDDYIGQKLDRFRCVATHPKAENFRSWYSKVAINQWVREMSPNERFTPEFELGVAVNDIDSGVRAAQDFFSQGHEQVVAKGEYGYSGLAQRIMKHNDSEGYLRTHTQSVMGRQQNILIEPWYDKVFDFSIQIDVLENGDMQWAGLARFLTDDKGRYIGARLGSFDQALDEEVRRFLHANDGEFGEFAAVIAEHLHGLGYFGPAGIDCLLHRRREGDLRLRLGLEVNPRWNMGRLAVELQQRLLPGRRGLWRLLDQREVGQDFVAFAEQVENDYPLRLKRGLWDSGVYVLTDPALAHSKLGVVFVGRDDDDIRQILEQLRIDSTELDII